MGSHRDRFEGRVLCELTPPLTDEGRSEFWESVGRRFTGLPYQEADLLSQSHKEFISSLFPEDDIYLCLLDAKARLVLGRVGEQTKPAQYLLEGIGFKYLEEVDPFDGGPHFGCPTDDISPIKLGKRYKVSDLNPNSHKTRGLVGTTTDDFKCVACTYDLINDEISLSDTTKRDLQLDSGEEIYLTPFDSEQEKT